MAWLAAAVRRCRGGGSLARLVQQQLVGGRWMSSSSPPSLEEGPSLRDFIASSAPPRASPNVAHVGAESSGGAMSQLRWEVGMPSPPLQEEGNAGGGKKVFVETYGCQMNVSDTEVLLAILKMEGFVVAEDALSADVVLLNTCAIRDNAEAKIWQRLGHFKNRKLAGKGPRVVGVLGCMAERLKEKLIESEKMVDIVVGPDSYRDLPRLITAVRSGAKGADAMNVQLSTEETYADITPVRSEGATTAFVSVMRGCNNMCAFCIVPFTRGRERSRPTASVLDEVRMLSEQGVKEVTLLGQNVNSFADFSGGGGQGAAAAAVSGGRSPAGGTAEVKDPFAVYASGFRSVYKPRRDGAVSFAELLYRVSEVDPEMRVRFTSPHPKDFPDELLHVVLERPNVCSQLHMPAQSGSSAVLESMRRGYTREAYLELVRHIRHTIPGASLSSDFISGFCGETEEDHAQTLSLLRKVGYDQAYLFAYSLREKTAAARHLNDDVPEEVKKRRLAECIDTFREVLRGRVQEEVGSLHLVLVDGPSKRSASELVGRTCTNKRVVIPTEAPPTYQGLAEGAGRMSLPRVPLVPGDYVAVRVEEAGKTLRGQALGRTTIADFHSVHGRFPWTLEARK
mmetsp:Transcript_6403/g.21998  ORF Transcript_6403/g.21998 Transcript_6403/m.21998 type:complete len:623 (+) Transcript_6403:119-1987(+)